MGICRTLKGSSSIIVEDIADVVRGMLSTSQASEVPDAGWRPHGVLVAHLQEHRVSVKDIAIQMIIVFSSSDLMILLPRYGIPKKWRRISRLGRGSLTPCMGASFEGTVSLVRVMYIVPRIVEERCPNTSMSATARPIVYAAAGCNGVSLWNAENGSCHQVLRLTNSDGEAEMSDLPWALSRNQRIAPTKASWNPINASFTWRGLVNRRNGLEDTQRGSSLLCLIFESKLTVLINSGDCCFCSRDCSYRMCGPMLKGIRKMRTSMKPDISSSGVWVVQSQDHI
ncbi:hypothetical protein C5167_044083 [Papaver somniferum]|uniref:Uncharacterized protein n=1 Tax=Papaver somniferum TaxID=3469 RepID=A0A4Y7LB45_PAPSO|nr:hypothetical protein C5167_044083 [Papaver somniferum]